MSTGIKCKLVIEIDGQVNELDVREITRIDPLRINDYLCENPQNIAYYGGIHGRVKSAADRQEWVVKKTRSQKAVEIRRKDHKISAAAVDDAVEADPEVISAYERLHELRQNEHIIYSFLMSLIAQRDCLIALANNIRTEMRMAEKS